MTGIWKNLIEKIQDNNGVIFQHDILPSMLFWLITLYSVYMCIYYQLKWPKVCRLLTSESRWTALVQWSRSHPLVKKQVSSDSSWHRCLGMSCLSVHASAVVEYLHQHALTAVPSLICLTWLAASWRKCLQLQHLSGIAKNRIGRRKDQMAVCQRFEQLVNDLELHHVPTHVRQRQVEDELLICKNEWPCACWRSRGDLSLRRDLRWSHLIWAFYLRCSVPTCSCVLDVWCSRSEWKRAETRFAYSGRWKQSNGKHLISLGMTSFVESFQFIIRISTSIGPFWKQKWLSG